MLFFFPDVNYFILASDMILDSGNLSTKTIGYSNACTLHMYTQTSLMWHTCVASLVVSAVYTCSYCTMCAYMRMFGSHAKHALCMFNMIHVNSLVSSYFGHYDAIVYKMKRRDIPNIIQ